MSPVASLLGDAVPGQILFIGSNFFRAIPVQQSDRFIAVNRGVHMCSGSDGKLPPSRYSKRSAHPCDGVKEECRTKATGDMGCRHGMDFVARLRDFNRQAPPA